MHSYKRCILVSEKGQRTSHYAGEACLSPDRNSTCDGGAAATRHPACTVVNVQPLSHCSGAQVEFSDDPSVVGRCTEGNHCIKTSAITAQCMSLDVWRAEFASYPEEEPSLVQCENRKPADDNSMEICCPQGSMPRLTADGTECCPWQIGKRSADDPALECCISTDACGVCGGSAKVVDADSVIRLLLPLALFICLTQ